MSKEPLDAQTREASWRASLTSEEQQRLTSRLASGGATAREEWETELALTHALGRLPDVPVASNFTARVVAEAQRDARQSQKSRVASWFGRLGPRGLLPRLAFTVFLVVAGSLSYRYAQDMRRIKLVEGLSAVSEVASLPSPEILQDFDAIRAFDHKPAADEELLALLK